MENKAIILFDGICNLCNSSVQFVIRHDKKEYFRFASLQSETGQQLQKKFNVAFADSIVLIENDQAYLKSTAALRIARRLNKLYPLLYPFILIPSPLRNLVYDVIARNRYKWFGKKDQCMIPSDELKSRFLDNPA